MRVHAHRLFAPVVALALGMALLMPIPGGEPRPASASDTDPVEKQRLRQLVQQEGTVRVIVELRLPAGAYTPEGYLLSRGAIGNQRRDIAATRSQLISRLRQAAHRVIHHYDAFPLLALEVGPDALAELEAAGIHVKRIMEDQRRYLMLPQSVPLVEGVQAWASGYDGSGSVIAIIDNGVDSAHPFLSGKVVEEACYVSGPGGCPNGEPSQTGTGAGVPCGPACEHGTHVAGIAAGSGAGAGVAFSGVAKGANLMSVNVFGSNSSAFDSDIIAGLNRVFTLRETHNFAAVNMSLGGGLFSSTCDSTFPQYKAPIDNLRSVGIATVIASGNDGAPKRISAPACISTAVSVGSTTKNDTVSWFSNSASFLSLLAPGGAATGIPDDDIHSSVPGDAYADFAGTSMAAPHVAGAWAILKQAASTATVTEILTALQSTGLPITDTRSAKNITKPRIRISEALAALGPVISAASPSSAALGATLDVTLTGGGFQAGAAVSFGAGITINSTAVNSSAQMLVNITVEPGTTPGERTITVTNPDGRILSLINGFTVLAPAPTIASLNPASVPVGGPAFTLTVNGTGFFTNSIVRVNGADRATTYVGDTQVTAAIPASDIAGGGTRNITVFTPGGGTSNTATLNVESPVPAITGLTPSGVTAWGPAFTLTVTGTGFTSSSVVEVNGSGRTTTYLSATSLSASVPASDIASAATALTITVSTPAPGGGTSNAATLTLTQPSLAVSAATVAPGASVTVTLTNAPGGSGDWLALAAVGAPNTSYLQWTYVGAGLTTRTWTVTMPTTLGQYEFRLFLNNGFTRAATSPSVSVANPNPPALTVSASTVAPGASVTVTLTNGLGGATDWLALAAVGTPSTSYLQFTYVGAGVTTRTWTVTMPTTLGQYEFRLFLNNGFTPAATSPAVSVANINPTPTITALSPSQVAAGSAAFTLTVTGTGYVTGATVQVNGSPRTTTLLSATQLTTTVLAADVATQGSVGVQVINPSTCAGGNCTSNVVTLGVIPPPPAPTLTGITPASVTLGGPAFTLTANGTGFVGSSVVQVNGSARPTTFVSATQLTASIPGSDIATAGALSVTVFTPAPGGGTSAPATLTVTGPTLTVSATSVAPGASVTVTLTNGLGGSTDWLALAAVGAPSTSYLQWTYVGAGLTTRSWTVTMPTTPGQYEVRLFLNNGFTLAATSPPITVANTNPNPTLTVSATSVAPGASVTVTLTNGLGGSTDWLALTTVGAPASSYLQWTYVGAGVTTRTWTVTMPATLGQYEFRLFLNNGFTLAATSPPVAVTSGP